MDGDGDDLDEGPLIEDPGAEDPVASLDDAPSEDFAGDDETFVGEDDPVGHDPADDEGVGGGDDDADEVPDEDGRRWTGGETATDDDGMDDLEDDTGDPSSDLGEDGPADDGSSDEVDELPPLDDGDDRDADESPETLTADLAEPLAAVGISAAPGVRAQRLRVDPPVHAMAIGAGRVLFAGDSLGFISISALRDPGVRVQPLRAPEGEVFTAVAEDLGGAVILGTSTGGVHRHGDDGAWQTVRRPGEGRGAGSVDGLLRDDRRLWARTRAGALLRAEEGVWREQSGVLEPVTALTMDATGATLVVSTPSGPELRGTVDGGRAWWRAVVPGSAPPWLLARVGDTIAVAPGMGDGPGRVTIDRGRTWSSWEIMAGATAIAMTETDDGVAAVVFAVYVVAEDRAVVLCVRTDARGLPVEPRKLFVLDRPAEAPREVDPDAPWCRVESLIPVDRAGRGILVMTARQVVLVARDG